MPASASCSRGRRRGDGLSGSDGAGGHRAGARRCRSGARRPAPDRARPGAGARSSRGRRRPARPGCAGWRPADRRRSSLRRGRGGGAGRRRRRGRAAGDTGRTVGTTAGLAGRRRDRRRVGADRVGCARACAGPVSTGGSAGAVGGRGRTRRGRRRVGGRRSVASAVPPVAGPAAESWPPGRRRTGPSRPDRVAPGVLAAGGARRTAARGGRRACRVTAGGRPQRRPRPAVAAVGLAASAAATGPPRWRPWRRAAATAPRRPRRPRRPPRPSSSRTRRRRAVAAPLLVELVAERPSPSPSRVGVALVVVAPGRAGAAADAPGRARVGVALVGLAQVGSEVARRCGRRRSVDAGDCARQHRAPGSGRIDTLDWVISSPSGTARGGT